MTKWKFVITYLIILLITALLGRIYATKTEYLITPETPEITRIKPQIPPILEKIALCESGNRQFNSSGTVLRGNYNKHDLGRFQINELYHASSAQKLGLDLYTDEGNTAFALYLYQTQGTTPWNLSKKCWDS